MCIHVCTQQWYYSPFCVKDSPDQRKDSREAQKKRLWDKSRKRYPNSPLAEFIQFGNNVVPTNLDHHIVCPETSG